MMLIWVSYLNLITRLDVAWSSKHDQVLHDFARPCSTKNGHMHMLHGPQKQGSESFTGVEGQRDRKARRKQDHPFPDFLGEEYW